MRNCVLVLTSNSSILSCNIYPPIELNQLSEYHIGLLSLDTYNAIANIKTGINDCFTMIFKDIHFPITIPQGSYEVSDIENVMLESMNDTYLRKTFGVEVPEPTLELIVNPVTNRVSLQSNYNIDFAVPKNFANILGFLPKKYVKGKKHIAPNRTDINPSSTIFVECSIASGAIKNGVTSHDIYQFVADVPPGYMLNQHPTNIIYHPINSSIIDNVCVKLVDSRGNLIDFSGEEVTARLHIKQWV